MKNCSIFGYQNIEITENLKSKISEILEKLIKKQNFDIFFFGELGDFEKLCLETARSFKPDYSYIRLV